MVVLFWPKLWLQNGAGGAGWPCPVAALAIDAELYWILCDGVGEAESGANPRLHRQCSMTGFCDTPEDSKRHHDQIRI